MNKIYLPTYKCVVDEELNKVKDDQDWEKCIEVNIKRESPLNILVPHPWLEQEGVGYVPQGRGNHQAHSHHVHEYHIEEEFQESPEMNAQYQGKPGLQNKIRKVEMDFPENMSDR